MEKLILKLRRDYPELTFIEGPLLCWSPKKRQISYGPTATDKDICGVLHEIGHARLKHSSFKSDADLIKKEILAWEEAHVVARHYGISLDNDHIQDCLDTYREWLYKRSTCPACTSKGLQVGHEQYTCVNCRHEWHVGRSRLCRPYRRSVE